MPTQFRMSGTSRHRRLRSSRVSLIWLASPCCTWRMGVAKTGRYSASPWRGRCGPDTPRFIRLCRAGATPSSSMSSTADSFAEHGGDIGGFSSLLTSIPEERSAFFIVNHGEGNDLRFRVKRALLDALYPGPQAHAIPKADPAKAPGLREYEGRYRSISHATPAAMLIPSRTSRCRPDRRGVELWGQGWLPLERDLSYGQMASDCWDSPGQPRP